MTYLSSRWQSFSAVLLTVSIAGTPYAFGIFSEIFKQELSFNQLDLSIIGSCGSTGLYTGVFCGIALERIGPRNLLLAGGLFVLIGNFYIWLAVQGIVWGTVSAISFAYFIAQVGIACTTMTATPLSIQIFPSEVTGQVAGLSKAYFGISSAVLATISGGFFNSTSKDFILFVSLFIPLVQFSAAKNANFLPQSLRSFNYEISQKRYHSLFPYICHLIGVFVVIIISGVVKHYFPTTSSPSRISMFLSIVVCCHLLSILIFPSFYGPRWINDATLDESVADPDGTSHSTGYPVATTGTRKSYMSLTSSTHSQVVTEPIDEETQHQQIEQEQLMNGLPSSVINFQDDRDGNIELNAVTSESTSYQSSDLTTVQQATSPPEFISFFNRHVPLQETITMWRCYAIMFTFMCITGSGILVINNIQAIVQALHQEASPFFVTILSLSNACGRLFIGVVADYFSAYVSRLQLLGIIAFFMALTQYTLSLGSISYLYPSLLLVGFLFGAGFSNVAATTSDIFGSKYIGSNYGFIDLAPAVGSYVFSTALIALYYPSEAGICYGSDCFQKPFYITSIFCLLSSILAIWMNHHTKIIKKF